MMDLGLFGIFTAGVLTFVTPCVLPLIPIYLSALIGGDIRQVGSAARGQLVARALLFSLGFVGVFTLLGLTASSIGGLLFQYKGLLSGAGALLVLVFGLKFLGLIRIPFFERIVRVDDSKIQTRFGGLNALIMGVVFAAGWSPCVGPVLGSVLTYTAAKTTEALVGGMYLAVYGLGFALPLLLTALFAEAGVRMLKRINPYLPKIERAIGILLVMVAVSMLADLAYTAREPADGVSQAEKADLLLDEDPVMVEFYSANCSICERMAPVVDAIVKQCDGRQVRVRKIDVSMAGNRRYVETYRLVGVPTFLFLNTKGEEIARLVGEQTEKTLKQALSALRGKPCPGLASLPRPSGEKPTEADLLFPLQQKPGEVSCSQGIMEREEHTDRGLAAIEDRIGCEEKIRNLN